MTRKILLIATIALSTATTSADGYIGHWIYSDKNFEQNRAKAMRMLRDRDHHVHGISVDDFRGQPVLEVEVFRDGREYDTVLFYPDLRIIRERIDY